VPNVLPILTIILVFCRIFNGKEHDVKLCILYYFLPSVKSTDAKRYTNSICMNIDFKKSFILTIFGDTSGSVLQDYEQTVFCYVTPVSLVLYFVLS